MGAAIARLRALGLKVTTFSARSNSSTAISGWPGRSGCLKRTALRAPDQRRNSDDGAPQSFDPARQPPVTTAVDPLSCEQGGTSL